MLCFRKGLKVFNSSEEFVKQAIQLGKDDVLLRIEHEYGMIDVVFNPAGTYLQGEVYKYLDESKEMFARLELKDVANEMISVLQLSSVLYEYISEAYKIAGLFEKTMLGPR
jgi:hypothetical protein